MDQYLVPCLKHLNEVLKQQDIDVEMELASNLEMMENIVPYFEEMLSDEPDTSIPDNESRLLGNYRDHVLA